MPLGRHLAVALSAVAPHDALCGLLRVRIVTQLASAHAAVQSVGVHGLAMHDLSETVAAGG